MSHRSDSTDACAPREEAAGGVVYRRIDGGVRVVLAEQRDRIHGGLTIRLPKGKLEPGESREQAALREVAEETGVKGRIVGSLDEVDYVYRTRRGSRVAKRVWFFLVEYLSGELRPADGEMERIFWCTPEEASRRLTFATEQRVMERARAQLEAERGSG